MSAVRGQGGGMRKSAHPMQCTRYDASIATMPAKPATASGLGSGCHPRPTAPPPPPPPPPSLPAPPPAPPLFLPPAALAGVPPPAPASPADAERASEALPSAGGALSEHDSVVRMSEIATPARQHAAGASTSMRRTITPEK